MSLLIWFLISAFATYRCARMVGIEEGPFRLFEKFRNLYTTPNWIGRGIRCPICLSFWFGICFGILLAFMVGLNPLQTAIASLALSGISSWLYERPI